MFSTLVSLLLYVFYAIEHIYTFGEGVETIGRTHVSPHHSIDVVSLEQLSRCNNRDFLDVSGNISLTCNTCSRCNFDSLLNICISRRG